MINFKILPGNTFDKEVKSGMRQTAGIEFIATAISKHVQVRKAVGDLLVGVFNDTEVAKSLRGTGTEDLGAHFGLTDQEANAFVDGMALIIRQSVDLVFSNNPSNIVIGVRAVKSGFDDFLNLPGAQHIAQPSNVSVPVARWLLIDPDIDIGQAAYDIVFSGDFSGMFNARINEVSRSGRAIMVGLKKLAGGTGYILPAIARGYAGQNFIEFTLSQPNVLENVSKVFFNSVI
jgi:F0F1-type ATP synthase membrane subunit c/vacuolar-type H+-ATPase subunit K